VYLSAVFLYVLGGTLC